MPDPRAPSDDRVRVVDSKQVAATGFSVLRQTEIDYRRGDGQWTRIHRETYDHGDGAAVLLFDRQRGCVLLVEQFRFPAFVNPTARAVADGTRGWTLEVPAGLIADQGHDGRSAEAAVIAEAEEEAGVRISAARRVMDAYSSPGSITERVMLFVAAYSQSDRVGPGGGLAAEGEDVVVVEPTLDEALNMVGRGEIADAKTVLLLFWAKLNLAELNSLGCS